MLKVLAEIGNMVAVFAALILLVFIVLPIHFVFEVVKFTPALLHELRTNLRRG